MKKLVSSAIGLAVLCLFGMAGCGGSGDTSVTATTTRITTVPDSAAVASVVDASTLAPRFAVFRGSREERDELHRRFPRQMIEALGLDLASSRYSRQIDGKPVYLVPAKRLVCLYTDNEAVGSCWKPAVIESAQAIATTLCGPGLGPDKVVTFGLVPDGVDQVTIVRTNVPSLTVSVEGNVFVAKTSSEPPLPTQVVWEQDGERVVRSSGIPAKIAREGC